MPSIPDFSSRAWQEARSDARLAVSILDGRGDWMPPWRGSISDDQAAELVAYIRSFGPATTRAAKPPTSDFSTRFRQLENRFNELEVQANALSRP
jgi:mono/diheme cytochrome c family protein